LGRIHVLAKLENSHRVGCQEYGFQVAGKFENVFRVDFSKTRPRYAIILNDEKIKRSVGITQCPLKFRKSVSPIQIQLDN
jgi:hypothetical protein